MNTFGERLRALREKHEKLSRDEFARRIGKSVSAVKTYEADEHAPSHSVIAKICDEFSVNSEWLLHGRGPMRGAPMQHERAPEAVEDMQGLVSIPYYLSRASAGAGAAVGRERIVKRLVIASEWLQQWGIRPLSAQLMTATGDSMLPTIQDGDVVLFETSAEQLRDGVYVVGRADDLLVKRLQRRADGSVALVSDNRLYPEQILTPSEAADMRVHGRVRMIFKKV